jgi:hypothetical protein
VSAIPFAASSKTFSWEGWRGFVARPGQKLEKWHMSRNESRDSSRRQGQNSTKMGCVRGARDESSDSSRNLSQKLEQ